MFYLQQGDVVIKPIKNVPKNALPLKENALAYGEVTGHAHRLHEGQFQIFETPKKERYLRVVTPSMLRHEEHKQFEVPPGDYKIDIVREYDHFEQLVRQVAD